MPKVYAATTTEPPFRFPERRGRYAKPTQKIQVYDAIRASKDGLTRHQVSAAVGLAPDRISFYLSDLRRAGFITIKGDPTVVSLDMTADDAAAAAMLGLENAFVVRLREDKALQNDAELTKEFLKYQKLKALALRPGTGPEGKVAMRMVLISLVKMVY